MLCRYMHVVDHPETKVDSTISSSTLSKELDVDDADLLALLLESDMTKCLRWDVRLLRLCMARTPCSRFLISGAAIVSRAREGPPRLRNLCGSPPFLLASNKSDRAVDGDMNCPGTTSLVGVSVPGVVVPDVTLPRNSFPRSSCWTSCYPGTPFPGMTCWTSHYPGTPFPGSSCRTPHCPETPFPGSLCQTPH